MREDACKVLSAQANGITLLVAELIVRVEALGRRLPVARPASGELVLDPALHSVVYADSGCC